MNTIHVVLPGDIDNPLSPSGGNTYDRRVCAELTATGTDGASRLVCVANVTLCKGQDVLVRALTEVADLHWTCECTGATDGEEEYVDRLRAHGLGARFTMPGPRTTEALEATYRTAGPAGPAVSRRDVRNGRDGAALTRVHSECLTGDVFASAHCECGDQLAAAPDRIVREGAGVLVYVRGHEGRGIGLLAKLKAMRLQEEGLGTVDANVALGLPIDARDHHSAAAVLLDLGVRSVRLLSNNPQKAGQLTRYGIRIEERVPLLVPPNPENLRYLRTKADRMDHHPSASTSPPNRWTSVSSTTCPFAAVARDGRPATPDSVYGRRPSVQQDRRLQLARVHVVVRRRPQARRPPVRDAGEQRRRTPRFLDHIGQYVVAAVPVDQHEPGDTRRAQRIRDVRDEGVQRPRGDADRAGPGRVLVRAGDRQRRQVQHGVGGGDRTRDRRRDDRVRDQRQVRAVLLETADRQHRDRRAPPLLVVRRREREQVGHGVSMPHRGPSRAERRPGFSVPRKAITAVAGRHAHRGGRGHSVESAAANAVCARLRKDIRTHLIVREGLFVRIPGTWWAAPRAR